MRGVTLGGAGDEGRVLGVRGQEELQGLKCYLAGPLLLSNVKDLSSYSLEHLSFESELAFEEHGLKF